MHVRLVVTAAPVSPMQSPLALGHHLRADPVPVQVMFQKSSPAPTFEKCECSTDRQQSKNENNKCLHDFDMGPQTAQFKNGVARC